MSEAVIRAENLGKRYRIGERERYVALRDVLTRALSAPARIFRPRKTVSHNGDPTHIWALKDVSFEVRQGEVVGIIGRNGAGKTTLLKILARVTRPTEGHAQVKGRLGSLLEVGTGFHPELTGRENVYLSGAILGMGKKEIERKFDEMVAFAEVEKFIDTPLKHYSSGMSMRLAFAVAAHLEPEILLVDEVLAVGDAAFQKKCLGKMGDVAKEGRTVLFVSHSMAAVSSLCRAAVLLELGTVSMMGPTALVMERYLAPLSSQPAFVDLRNGRDRSGTGEIRITAAALRDSTGMPCAHFKYLDEISFELTLERLSEAPPVFCAVQIHTITGVPVLHLYSADDPGAGPFQVSQTLKVRCKLEACDLYPGTYVVSLWVGPSPHHDTDFVVGAMQFRMEQGELVSRGFDMNWTHAVVHRRSCWH